MKNFIRKLLKWKSRRKGLGIKIISLDEVAAEAGFISPPVNGAYFPTGQWRRASLWGLDPTGASDARKF